MTLKITYLMLYFSLYGAIFSQKLDENKTLSKFFKEANVKGSFLLYDLKKDKFIAYDNKRCKKRFFPASTFKIPNSLIGLETGVIKDENFVIKWNEVKYPIEAWNQDHTLKSAIKVSCVPYYQELARRVGETKMKEYIRKLQYGNMDISGGVDKFWLEGGLKISQYEQIDFLKKLYQYNLPFSKRNIDIVKSIIILEDSTGYKLSGKTGWAIRKGNNTGWFVGYIEKGDDVYFFATNIESDKQDDNFASLRIPITKKILKELGIID
jgi:beta-lactamase class D